MPTLAVWLREPDYARVVRAAEARNSTGAKLVQDTLELILGDKALQRKLWGSSAD